MKRSNKNFYCGCLCLIAATILVFLLALISGCSLFSVKDYNIVNQDAKTVALYNLSVLQVCNVSNTNYLYVDRDFDTTTRNLFVYINDLNEDLARSKLCFKTLENYNLMVAEQKKI